MASLERLDGAGFVRLVSAGHARLKRHKDVVNALNIFPVPDGDTGTNMELSLASGVSRLHDRRDWTLNAAAQALAGGLLMGARGNSGVILSQLFRGFLKATQRTEALDVPAFAESLQEGVAIAYRAVAKPVEGTILTVAREAAAVGIREARNQNDLAAWMKLVNKAGADALKRTPLQLAVLKEAGVVDSGGQGLLYIYEGFLDFLSGGSESESEPDAESASASERPAAIHVSPQRSFAAAEVHHEGEYGYCTEVLVRVSGDVEGVQAHLRQQLSGYGDSLLVVGADDLVKVHVHTLHPGRVLEDALAEGALVKIKIDNMTEQHAEILANPSQPGDADDTHPPTVAESEGKGRMQTKEAKSVSVVVVAAGDGLRDIFSSLGADIVLSGGQTMNPSTEEIVEAVLATGSPSVIVLPNNRNIVMAANQAREVLGEQVVHVVPTGTIPEGISALMAFRTSDSVESNAERMRAAIASVNAGQVVRAVRDSVYQDKPIVAGQYLGLVNQDLTEVGDDRLTVGLKVVAAMGAENAELLAVFYGSNVPEGEVAELSRTLNERFGLEVECRSGGQPIYDYIFALE